MLDNKAFGQRICLMRKNKQYTQEELGKLLGITPQAISKWEQGNALPDITLLPQLAKLLSCSLDYLLKGIHNADGYTSPYDNEYAQEGYYWGLEPSELAKQIVLLNATNQYKTLLDIGSGEGRDAIYFSQNGLQVEALEISAHGIDKIQKASLMNRYNITSIHADMIGYELSSSYDIVYSCGSLQFLPPKQRLEHFEGYKAHTIKSGLNAHLVFVNKPFIKPAPDWQANEYFYKSGELATYYADWEILSYQEQVIDCNSMDIPHQHAICSIIAKKVY